ncbi:hypothetical protein N7491_007416 [Penicillium cf. griseofulvum]|uniref:Uncharacterized protein n=1 Tax=Penicillium cf. griseofulvum TaxID=2972120 RepID=A0A9W9IU07_9EURO|nr:hypothetical protein N7472_009555 [Penicillium cf. griseofulvum]KAJ5430400.1 hypothetical protein N7491_007416 [Penicillium cf. griseofulvum]KAJ5435830.1 hypothetical protein N7445_006715 [Penicillium cf. griseofulvum]
MQTARLHHFQLKLAQEPILYFGTNRVRDRSLRVNVTNNPRIVNDLDGSIVVCGGELGLFPVVMVGLVVGSFVSPLSLTAWWRIAVELNEVWMDEA